MILRVDPDVTTLIDYHHSPHRKAEHGGHGAGGHRNGAHGADLVLPGPRRHRRHRRRRRASSPTWSAPAPSWSSPRAAAAGSATPRWPASKRKAPGFALLGEPGDELDDRPRAQGRRRHRPGRLPQRRQVQPDRGDLARPAQDRRLPVHHAGAQPRRRHAPATRRSPSPTCPGLIEGASEGRGLGHDFLRHIERCAALVHVIDTATIEPGRNPVDDLDVIENELARYGGLEDRPAAGRAQQDRRPRRPRHRRHRRRRPRARAACGSSPVSRRLRRGAARADLRDGRDRRRPRAGRHAGRRDASGSCSARRRRATAAPTSPSPRPARAGGCAARSPSAGSARPTSATTRPSASSPTGSTGSASRTRLLELGAVEGDTVLIGHPDNAVVFDFKPGVDAGAEMLGRRGEDQRFDEERPAAAPTPRRSTRRMDERGEGETRADVARRLDQARGRGPTSLRDRRRPRTPTGPRTTPDERRRLTTAAASEVDRRPAGSWSRSARRR